MKISGIHHIAITCVGLEEYEKAIHFYRDLLGFQEVHAWGSGETKAIMLDSGSGIVELFSNGKRRLGVGDLCHVAFATDDVDECIRRVREAGYEVTQEPEDVDIPSTPVFPVRTAFCKGPAEEIVEFFKEL